MTSDSHINDRGSPAAGRGSTPAVRCSRWLGGRINEFGNLLVPHHSRKYRIEPLVVGALSGTSRPCRVESLTDNPTQVGWQPVAPPKLTSKRLWVSALQMIDKQRCEQGAGTVTPPTKLTANAFGALGRSQHSSRHVLKFGNSIAHFAERLRRVLINAVRRWHPEPKQALSDQITV